MHFNMEFARTMSTPDIFNRPLPPLPPSISPRPASGRSHTDSLLTRTNSVNSEDTLWTAPSNGSGSPTQFKKNRLWGRHNSFTFGRKSNRPSRRSSLTDDTATLVSFGEVESLCDDSSAENAASETSSAFPDLNRTVERYGMPHHPFSIEEVPYMQSYSPTALDSDYHTFELLRRLNPNINSPTFHDYGRRPPKNVLDLGCGEGHWVLHAARTWRSAGTHVTGLDLIDLYNNDHGRVSSTREGEAPPRNVTFVRGNILKHRLPFSDGSFDLVRMANLTLVIPYLDWDFVFFEIKRLFFPRIPSILEMRGYQVPSPINPDFSPNLWQELLSARHDAQSIQRLLVARQRHKRSQSDVEYDSSAQAAQELEKIFKSMLVDKYEYAPETHQYLTHALEHFFGRGQARMAHEFRLGVPSREFVDGGDVRESTKRPVRRPRHSDGDVQIPTSPRDCALRVLVGDGESSKPPKAPQPYQPPGLILLPTSLNKLLPFSPTELEMHAEVETSPLTPLLRLGSSSPSFQGRDRSSSNPISPRKLKTKTERAIEVRVIRVYNVVNL
ncbi:uncharacterized protein B0H18DRAFT_996133 [Fomitopsis serialis]|uniref:uncharacterized protein n=1 Tax=Fomitopsis serialis TaxID=139415 RepID=UPI00200825D7|nr:uncharacterized protein B0H18DRAFT_996133 [Neoantrodia serialis]KAH9929759.1 hypothetical protein B0H18DRAFT_996133 [Neoantrodia serialis]